MVVRRTNYIAPQIIYFVIGIFIKKRDKKIIEDNKHFLKTVQSWLLDRF